jgi:hypothetical protein
MRGHFDFNKKYMIFDLQYRRDCDGDPSRAFTIVNASVKDVAHLQDESRRLMEMGSSHRRERTAQLKARFPSDFLGILMVMYWMEDSFKWETYELFGPPLGQGPRASPTDPWLMRLQTSVNRGLVFRKQVETEPWKLGKMEKSKGRWKWKELSQAEIDQLDPPPDFDQLAML